LFTLLHKEGLNGLRRGIGANTVRAMLMNVCTKLVCCLPTALT
jgi:hypothetical protein